MLFARSDGVRFQTLADHTNEVAKLSAKSCIHVGLRSMGELVGLLHDSGKSYEKWQRYLIESRPTETIPHSGPSVWFTRRLFANCSDNMSEPTLQIICIAIRGHHGGLRDVLRPDGELDEPVEDTYSADEKKQAEEMFFAEVVSKERLLALFSDACIEISALISKAYSNVDKNNDNAKNILMLQMGLVQKFVYAALIDADRLNAATWENELLSSHNELSPQWKVHISNLERKLNSFDRDGINQIRGEISDACKNFEAAQNGIYRLYIPTGGGKTLSSLNISLRTAAKWGKDRIFFFIPFLTILEQNAQEIREAIGEDGSSEIGSVLEHHSNIVWDVTPETEAKEQLYKRQTERWSSNEIIMTSTIQLLNTFYSGNSASVRRLRALANSVIVIDEVQAIPSSCTYLFTQAMNFLAAFCNCVVILCTATPPPLDQLKYPIKMSIPVDIIPNTTELFHSFKRTEVKFENLEKPLKIDEIADYVVDKWRLNGNCLLVMNTKSAARKIYLNLEQRAELCNVHIYYLSTELCPAHRTMLLKEIKSLLNKEPVICISTQLIEAGVNISFGCVIRALAGFDSIVQAAGRCNRHGEDTQKDVYVVPCKDERLDSLRDILEGQKATYQLLFDFSNNQEALGGDILSPQAVLRYYEYYYFRREKTLGYSLQNGKTAVNLMGYNEAARNEYWCEYNTVFKPCLLAQSFKTVGNSFSPIQENTTGVIVPYANSDELLEELYHAKTPQIKARQLRRLQKFTVNLYQNKLDELFKKGAVSYNDENGIWVLHKGFYSNVTGINISAIEQADYYIL